MRPSISGQLSLRAENISASVLFWAMQFRRVWGVQGIAAVSLTLCLVAFLSAWYMPARFQLATLRAEIARSADNSQSTVSAKDDPSESDSLAAFFRGFPPNSLILTMTSEINRIAEKSNLTIQQADFHPVQDSTGLVRYEINISAHSTYFQMRHFVAESLTKLPTMALDGIKLSRSATNSPTIEMQFRFSLFMRGS